MTVIKAFFYRIYIQLVVGFWYLFQECGKLVKLFLILNYSKIIAVS